MPTVREKNSFKNMDMRSFLTLFSRFLFDVLDDEEKLNPNLLRGPNFERGTEVNHFADKISIAMLSFHKMLTGK